MKATTELDHKVLKIDGAEVQVYSTARELAEAAARRFVQLANSFISTEGRFTVALSGGSTPRLMFGLLASKPLVDSIEWSRVYFFWGDERRVPPEDPESNYRAARETLLSKIDAPDENIFRIPAEIEDPELAARRYAAALEDFFRVKGQELPRFDLVLLGMGADAHTASLFPHTAAVRATGKVAVANYVNKLEAYRITLTAEAINEARNIIFLVAGSDKAPALASVLCGSREPETYPSQLIRPASGSLVWMIDEAASAQLRARVAD